MARRYRELLDSVFSIMRRKLDEWQPIPPLYRVDCNNYKDLLFPLHEARLIVEGDDLVIESMGDDPYLETSCLRLESGRRYQISLTISFPAYTSVQFFFGRHGSGYNEIDSKVVFVARGMNRVTIDLPEPETIQRVRFDPGDRPGRYVLKQLMILELRHFELTKNKVAFLDAPDFSPPEKVDRYEAWLEVNKWNARCQMHLGDRLSSSEGKLPKISVVVPVYNPPPEFFASMISSVESQVYTNWELCMADDGSTDPEIKRLLVQAQARDSRIRVFYRQTNGGISEATNSAASIATGEFLAFLDSDDELPPDALGEVALYLGEHTETDFLYTDDDKIDVKGRRYDPQFKPDWSPELLLSHMYFCHLVVVKRPLFSELGKMRNDYTGSQDHDLALRGTDKIRKIGHIPMILYNWRAFPGSGALSEQDAKPYALEAGKRAIGDSLKRRGQAGHPYQMNWALKCTSIWHHEFPDDGPLVSILIRIKKGIGVLNRCLGSLDQTSYRNCEIILIDEEGIAGDVSDYLTHLPHKLISVENSGKRLDFSYVNNTVVKRLGSEYVLFLDCDTEVKEARWLSRMMGYGRFHGVGAVGAKLMYPDGRIWHAGMVQGVRCGLPDHAFRGTPGRDKGYLGYASVPRNCIGVSADCMLTPRSVFLEAGGFDEKDFGENYYDADYCLRLMDQGYRVVYCPGAELIHNGAEHKNKAVDVRADQAYISKYHSRKDPYYNPNLSLDSPPLFEIQPRKIVLGPVKPIRTLVCSPSLESNGFSLYAYLLSVALKNAGAIYPVILSAFNGPLKAKYEAHGIEVRLGSEFSLPGSWQEYEEIKVAIRGIINELNLGLVFADTLKAWTAIGAAADLGIPSVWRLPEDDFWEQFSKTWTKDLINKGVECFSHPYRIIFHSENSRDLAEQLNSKYNFTTICQVSNSESGFTSEDIINSCEMVVSGKVKGSSDQDRTDQLSQRKLCDCFNSLIEKYTVLCREAYFSSGD